MEEYERRQRREREKYERQQIQPVDRAYSLFPEPRRVDPSEVDDHITSKLGVYSEVKDFIGLGTVGISSCGHRTQQLPPNAVAPGNMPISASGGGVMPLSGSSRIPPLQQQQQSQQQQPPHHYQQQQQQQQSRQPYIKHADNKPPYNGRGGYPGQPVKNDIRSSSGMAPPKGPPLMSSSSSQMSSTSLLQPPATSIMPNGRQSSVDKIGSLSSSTSSASFLGPPAPMLTTHNGRFSQPSIPKIRQKNPPESQDVTQMIADITKTFRAPSKITEIAATPRITTTGENYNLNGPNKHKYSFDPIGAITPIAPLETFASIQPLPDLPVAFTSTAPTSSVSAISSTIPSRPKEPMKPLKIEKSGPTLEKQNSTLEHDLELSESDDERKKHVSSPPNSSESSQSDSSESGNEKSTKDEQQHHHQQQQQHLHQQQHRMGVSTSSLGSNQTKKKISQTITAGGGTTISGILSSSAGLGSAGSSCSAPSSTSSSNKAPSKSDSHKWHLRNYFGINSTQQTQNNSSPNGASGVPMTLPGGAHIIPERTPTPLPLPSASAVATSSSLVTSVKNENIVDDDEDDDDDDADSGDHHAISPPSVNDAFRLPAAFAASRKPELSLLDKIKKESDTLFPHPMTTKNMVQQQQVPLLNAAEFVAIPTSQIKNEGAPSVVGTSLIAGGVTTVTPYNKRSSPAASSPVVPPHLHHHHGDDINFGPDLRQEAKKYMPKEILSEMSSDSNSSEAHEAVTIPMPGPGGTLQIPGVPAAITALPRSPPHMQLKPQMLPNSLTVTAINPSSPALSNTGVKYKTKSPSTAQLLGVGSAVQRSKKKHKHKQLPSASIDSSDEDGEYSQSSSVVASASVSPAIVGGSGGNKLQHAIEPVTVDSATVATVTTAASAKKGRGRPRKNTPSQSGNISSASSTTTKGPTLTAKKDVSSKKPTGRRKISRQNSGGNATSSTTSTPQVTPTKATNANKKQATIASSTSSHSHKQRQQQQHKSNEYIASSTDSSSSSSSYSTSKSSTSSSDSEEGSASDSSVDDPKKQNRNLTAATAAATAAAIAPARRIVKQLNKRKSSLDDVAVATTGITSTATNSGKKGRTSSSHTTDDAFRDLLTTSSSEESSAEDYGVIVPSESVSNVNAASNSLPHVNNFNSGPHRQQNQQSPLKLTSSSKSQVSTSSSSTGSSSTSTSSGEDQSDSDCDVTRKEKKLRRDKPKSDKNKINTLSRIFNPKEGGAKKQGQVVIIDQSEELLAKEQHHLQLQQQQQQHQQQQQQQHQQQQQQLLQQKQPNAAFKLSNQENLSALITSATTATSHSNSFHSSTTAASTITQSQSPRLTPSHMKSPRNPVSATQQQHILSRTPDRSSSSSERKLHQRIKTPTRTPTRTPPTRTPPTRTPPTTRTPTPTASLTPQHLNSSSSAAVAAAAAAAVVASSPAVSAITSLICKIELSRLLHIAPEWHTNTYRLYTATVPPPVAASPRTGRLTPSTGSTAGRTPIYDHETILNADLQATQLRLKPSAVGGSGRNTPNSAPIEQQRELSRSRENLIEMGTGKQRLDEVNSSSGRLSSRSVDIASGVGVGCPTPKALPPPQMPLNGYTARGLNTSATLSAGGSSPSATTKFMLGVKHEHIKFEPDIDTAMPPTALYCTTDTKFKSSSVVKQELILKHDFKPATAGDIMPPSEKQLMMAVDSPGAVLSGGDIAKPRRKRSSSSSSSPYKEKKRKKEKDKDKDREKEKDSSLTSKEKEKDKLNSTNNNNGSHRGTIASDVEVEVGSEVTSVPQSEKEILLDQQLPPTNHDRLMDKQILAVTASSQPQKPSQVTVTVLHMPPPPPTTVTTVATTTPAASVELHEESTATTVSELRLPATAQSNIAPQHSTHLATSAVPPTQPQVVYRSYFERDEDVLSDDFSRNTKFLDEAVNRKHAADDEQNTFNQVTLYLEAVVYFLLSGAAMEQHRTSENAAWTIYKDTLALIKFISSKFRHLQVSSSNGQHETHNKVAILSLRCQSLISLKLYKMKRTFCRSVISACSEFFKSGKGDIVNGNTPSSISPSNSVCSQGSGSNTPPGKIVPQDVHTALLQQNQFFSYLTSSHDLWDQADRLVRQGNHTDFFIALDHENGPLTLHSSMYEVFRYVQAGLKKLKDAM